MTILISLFAFLLAITILVTIHEFGHFLVARLCGIRVLRFSIGFGKPLLSYLDRQGTEYVVAALPLGGYVKMLDEHEAPVPSEEVHRAFNRQPLWKRVLVVLAGPLANFLFAILVYWILLTVGITHLAPKIGKVLPHSVAETAKFAPGDQIMAVDGKPIFNWQQIRLALLEHAFSTTPLQVSVLTSAREKIDRIIPPRPREQVTNKNLEDLIIEMGLTPYLPPIPPIIAKLAPQQAGVRAGLKPGDKIVKVDNRVISDWIPLIDYIKARPHATVNFTVERKENQSQNTQLLTIPVPLEAKVDKNGKTYGYLGAQAIPHQWSPELLVVEKYPWWQAWQPAVTQSLHLTALTFKLFGKLITGTLSLHTLSGPVGIAVGAGQSVRFGLDAYLSFLALISISLAVINILPIPMLDGGYLVLFVYEALFRRPVPRYLQEWWLKIGLVLIIFFTGLALFNDMSNLLR